MGLESVSASEDVIGDLVQKCHSVSFSKVIIKPQHKYLSPSWNTANRQWDALKDRVT